MSTILSTLLVFIPAIFSQNLPLVCDLISPNNDPNDKTCRNGTTNFFNAERPFRTFLNPCLCCDEGPERIMPNCGFNETLKANSISMKVECTENFDCCLCGSIMCDPCTDVICNGDQSCIGVKPLIVRGKAAVGSSVDCNGDVSCFGIELDGERIKSVKCDGDFSCANSTLRINVNQPFGTITAVSLPFNGDESGLNIDIIGKNIGRVGCDGDSSCRNSLMTLDCALVAPDTGCPLSLNGDRSGEKGIWTVKNAASLIMNGDMAALMSTFDILFQPAGGRVVATGDDSATDAIWNLRNVGSLSCAGPNSCKSATINSTFILNNKDTRSNFGGLMSALGATLRLINTASVTCSNVRACQGATITAIGVPNGGDTSGASLTCRGINACFKATISITNANTLIFGGSNGAGESNINAQCITTGCPVTCNSACPNANINTINSRGLSCIGGVGSPVTIGACEDLEIALTNNRGGGISCSTTRSCINALITDGSNGIVTRLDNGIFCSGNGCFNATIKGECRSTCPLQCIGIRSCETDDISKIIQLNKASKFLCTAGCSGRTFIIAPGNTQTFNTECGAGACRNTKINLPGTFAGNGFRVSGIQCGSTNGCRNSIWNFILQPNQVLRITKIFCTANNACRDAQFIITLQTITQLIVISEIECGTQGCRNTLVQLKLNENGVIRDLTAAEIEAKERANTLRFNANCALPQNCEGASINRQIQFAVPSQFNWLVPKKDKLTFVQEFGAIWLSLVGIFAIVIIIIITKHYKYIKNVKNMEKDITFNKNDRRKQMKKVITNSEMKDLNKIDEDTQNPFDRTTDAI